jgi:hypothetical protein
MHSLAFTARGSLDHKTRNSNANQLCIATWSVFCLYRQVKNNSLIDSITQVRPSFYRTCCLWSSYDRIWFSGSDKQEMFILTCCLLFYKSTTGGCERTFLSVHVTDSSGELWPLHFINFEHLCLLRQFETRTPWKNTNGCLKKNDLAFVLCIRLHWVLENINQQI